MALTYVYSLSYFIDDCSNIESPILLFNVYYLLYIVLTGNVDTHYY